MRYFILYALLFFSGLICFSQENNQDKEKESYKYNTIEKKPEFPGGMEAFFKYIGNNYKTPKVSNLSGKIYLNFVIEKDGSIVEVKVLRDLGYGTGEEAVRVLSESPKWSPGMQNGQPVRVMFNLPISIQSSR
jgi:periplasmic protein TonB